ncbi:MAG: type II toxin-antitoxin system Phd/YefM family antitoxin [Sandaracinaceae bacterium]|nr:type II toxin-antitoxin system Phd/YefM family antitoxin [Sandaracinaceae bacterium]
MRPTPNRATRSTEVGVRSRFDSDHAAARPRARDRPRPIGEFRSRTAKLIAEMKDEGRTLVITQNGKAAAVVMSPECFDALR